MLPNNKPHTGQTVRDEDKENDEKAENDCTVLGKSENLYNKTRNNYCYAFPFHFLQKPCQPDQPGQLEDINRGKNCPEGIKMRYQNILCGDFLTFHASRTVQLSEN